MLFRNAKKRVYDLLRIMGYYYLLAISRSWERPDGTIHITQHKVQTDALRFPYSQ